MLDHPLAEKASWSACGRCSRRSLTRPAAGFWRTIVAPLLPLEQRLDSLARHAFGRGVIYLPHNGRDPCSRVIEDTREDEARDRAIRPPLPPSHRRKPSNETGRLGIWRVKPR